ncbi:Ig lambda-2 chain C region isoform 1-T2 [Clarias gariepinus]
MPPSQKELCNANIKGDKVTLVCLAKDFYPDHVSINWNVNGKERTHGVATDHVAQQDPDTRLYSMSSRLRVNLTEWTNIKNKFTCISKFYDGKEYEKIHQTIRFIPDKIPVRTFVTVRFGYLMFLGKSLLYAAFISIVVWRCRATKEKTLMTEDGDIMMS